jgi:hypothetical protein
VTVQLPNDKDYAILCDLIVADLPLSEADAMAFVQGYLDQLNGIVPKPKRETA